MKEALEAGPNSSEETALRTRLADVQRALREPVEFETGDDLMDEWERDLAAGRVPDLQKGFKGPKVNNGG